MCKRGGFFGQLMAHSDKLRLMSYRKINVPESDITAQPESQVKPEDIERAQREVKQILQHHLAKIHEDFFHWIFPSSKDKQEKKANQNDVEGLKTLFHKIAKEIITDRD